MIKLPFDIKPSRNVEPLKKPLLTLVLQSEKPMILTRSETKQPKKIRRPFLNETGPGDYSLPTGPLVPDKKTGPAFSFGVKRTAQFISKEYLKVLFALNLL
jgi:hypothetical protein